MTQANLSHRTKENSFSEQIKIGDSESVIVFDPSTSQKHMNHGSHPKVMTQANMSYRTKEKNLSEQIRIGGSS